MPVARHFGHSDTSAPRSHHGGGHRADPGKSRDRGRATQPGELDTEPAIKERALNLLYLVLNLVEEERKMPPCLWTMAKARLAIPFENRFNLA